MCPCACSSSTHKTLAKLDIWKKMRAVEIQKEEAALKEEADLDRSKLNGRTA